MYSDLQALTKQPLLIPPTPQEVPGHHTFPPQHILQLMEFLMRAEEPVNTLIQTKGWTPVTGRLFDNRRHKNDHSVWLPTQQDSRQIRLHDVILE